MRHGSAVVLALALLAPVGAAAADDVGRVKVVKGSVTIQRSGGSLPATVGMKLLEGDVIATGRDGSAGAGRASGGCRGPYRGPPFQWTASSTVTQLRSPVRV